MLTSSFPYEGGEQFIEAEIKYWEGTAFDNVYILPNSAKGEKRAYPPNIGILNNNKDNRKVVYAILTLVNPILAKEISYILRKTKVKCWFNNLREAWRTTAILTREVRRLKSTLSPIINTDIIVYSYWNDISYYAAMVLKKEKVVKKVVSRAHRYDLYEERRENQYMPLKRQFANGHDGIYLLSVKAINYFSKKYNADNNILKLGRLGVSIPENIRIYNENKDTTFKVLSLSYCAPVKQIELIIRALDSYAKLYPSLLIRWTHIGAGDLFDSLVEKAYVVTKENTNLEIDFVGHKSNKEVLDIIKTQAFAVFVNASQSEGIPVSIMEAMSYGIPAIAPDVGGISDLVNNSCGYLMPALCSEIDIVKGFDYIRLNKENINFNLNSYSQVKEEFNADFNYPEFIKELEKAAGLHEK